MKIQGFFPNYKTFDNYILKCTQQQDSGRSNSLEYTSKQSEAVRSLAFSGLKHTRDIKKLVKNGELHENAAIYGIQKASRLNEDALLDLQRLKQAKRQGLDIKDVFVPDFENENTAKESLSVGDVCQIKGDKFISIMDKEGEILKLALSKEKYMELFPPVGRFSVMQNRIGDCWFLSSLNAMYICPSTRATLLSTYKENKEGGIDINFKGFDSDGNNAVEKDEEEKTIENADKFTALRAFSPKGFACAEEAYEQRQAGIAYKRIEKMYNTFEDALKEQNKEDILADDLVFSRDEAKKFIETAKPYMGDPVGMSKVLFDPKAKDEYVEFNEGKLKEYLEKLDSSEYKDYFSKSEIDLMKQIVLRNNDWLKRKERYQHLIQDVVPTAFFVKYSNKDYKDGITEEAISREVATPYIAGGKIAELLKLYGLYAYTSHSPEREAEKSKKHWVLVAGTGDKNTKKTGYEIGKNHAYALKVINAEGEKHFGIRDPHNSSVEIIMNKSEIGEAFDSITYAWDDN